MAWLLALLLAQESIAPAIPFGPWALSTKDTGCQIIRSFGSSDKVALGFESTITSQSRIMLVIASKNTLPEKTGDITVTLNGTDAVQAHYGSFETPNPNIRMIKVFFEAADSARLVGTTSVSIDKQVLVFQNPQIGAALKALDKCTIDLISSWGVDPANYLNGKLAKVKGNIGQWFTAASYPREARAKRAAGRVVLLLTSTVEGDVESCKVVASPDESLNAGTCAIATRRIKLTPPIDDAGRPTTSYTILPIHWFVP